jgi:serine/threonine protein kinase
VAEAKSELYGRGSIGLLRTPGKLMVADHEHPADSSSQVPWRVAIRAEELKVMRSSKGAGARVSPARAGMVSLSEGDTWVSPRRIIVEFDDGVTADIPLDFAYANYTIWRGQRVRILGIEPDDCDADGWGFSVTRDGESVRWLFSCSNLASARRWLDVLRNEGCVMSDFSQKFRLTEILGNGGASTVFHGEVLPTAKLGSGVPAVAVKSASTDHGKRQLRMESRFLAALSHRAIVRAHGLYELIIRQEKCFVLVLECVEGGDLHNFLDPAGMDEVEARSICEQLLSAVAYCHKREVVHRDIKLTNILAYRSARGGGLRVRLSDFGLAADTWDCEEMTRRCGSPGFIAPEVLKKYKYNEKIDVFSLGVVLYQLLTGVGMFRARSMRTVLAMNARAEIPMADIAHLSSAVQDLVRGMCASDPRRRLSAEEALESRWIKGSCAVIKQPTPKRTSDAGQRWEKGELFNSQVLPLHYLTAAENCTFSNNAFSYLPDSSGLLESHSVDYVGSDYETEQDLSEPGPHGSVSLDELLTQSPMVSCSLIPQFGDSGSKSCERLVHGSDRIAEAKWASRSIGTDWSKGSMPSAAAAAVAPFDVEKAVNSLEDKLKQDLWDVIYEVSDRSSEAERDRACELECKVQDVDGKGVNVPECTPEEQATNLRTRMNLYMNLHKSADSNTQEQRSPPHRPEPPASGKDGCFVPLSPTQKGGTPPPASVNPFRNFSVSGSDKSTPQLSPPPLPPRARHFVLPGGTNSGLTPHAPPRNVDNPDMAGASRTREASSSGSRSPHCADDPGSDAEACSDEEHVRLPTISARTSKNTNLRIETA